MRLGFSCQTFKHIFYSPSIINDYPNLCWCMLVSFATDAYTTIDGLMHSGRYSFATLAKDNAKINEKYKETMSKMEETIPNIRNIRNQMFCHLVHKQTNEVIQKIYIHCWDFINYLKELHRHCCKIYGIDESELNGYDTDTFTAFDRELKEFDKLLMDGGISIFYDILSEIQNGKPFKNAKEIRHKRIKAEQ